jgi:hypothetical protein
MFRSPHLSGALLLLLLGPALFAQENFTEPKVKIHGVVLTSEGKPAAGATVYITNNGEPEGKTKTNDRGEFETSAIVNSRAGIYATTADQSEQKWLHIPTHTLRTHGGPYTVTMLKSIPVRCRFVDLSGKPVEGVRVAAFHHTRHSAPILSDARGEASFFLYSEWKQNISGICGVHEKLGYFVSISDDSIAISLENPDRPVVEFHQVKAKPRVIHIFDLDGKPVSNVRLHASIGLHSGTHAFADGVPAAEALSNERGEATFQWMPQEITYFHPEIEGKDWKECGYLEHADGGPKGIKVVPYSWVTGKLKGPPGADLTGILIAGEANHSEADSFALASCRSDAEGRFRLKAPADHALTIEVQDQEFVSDNVTALVPREGESTPVLELTAQTGRRLRVQFKGYKKTEAFPPPFVEIGRLSQIIDPISGEKKQHSAFRCKTSSCDENGAVDFTVFPGRYVVYCQRGDWRHEETITVGEEDAEVRIALPNLHARNVHGDSSASPKTP